MNRLPDENMWTLLDIVNGIECAILLGLLAVCARFVFIVVRDGMKPPRASGHRFVHPLSTSAGEKRADNIRKADNAKMIEQPSASRDSRTTPV